MAATNAPALDLGDATRNLDAGFTLPADWYTSPEIFALEKRVVFGRGWQYVGRTDQLAVDGSFFTCRAGDIPIVVTRDAQGTLRAFVNVCRHRGSEVVLEPEGCRNTLQCHYHGWTYGLDGALRAAPREKQEPGFDRSEYGLYPVQVQTWGPFVFVKPTPGGPSLAEHVSWLAGLLDATGADVDAVRYTRKYEYDLAVNWKVAVENFLECYHCAVTHPDFADVTDLNRFTVTPNGKVITEVGPPKDGMGPDAGMEPGTEPPGLIREGRYSYVWPNFMLNVFPGAGNLSTNRIVPLAVDRTRIVYEFFFVEGVPQAEQDEIVAFAAQIQEEDNVIVESVQRGLASGMLDRGKLFLSIENGPHHFQRLLVAELAEAAAESAAESAA